MLLIQRVSKVYHLYRRPSDRILELLPFSSNKLHSDFWALRDVSFSAERGETLGIVGPNGSGKSTLLQIVSGILKPTHGRVVTEGRIAALLELGAGFNPEFTGRENVYLNGEIMGLSRREIDLAFPLISAFAEIGEFMDRPVSEYSSGMYVRLAFATAIHVEPEILIVDEALAVGDAIFANRCIRKFEELKKKGVTVLFVSHDLGLVKRLCHRAVFMFNGRVEAVGKPNDVINRYVGMVLAKEQGAETSGSQARLSSSFRHGDRRSEIIDLRLLDDNGMECTTVPCGDRITVKIRARYSQEVAEPVVGILIRNRLGIDVFGTNTKLERQELGSLEPGQELQVDFAFDCWLTQQEYTLTVATQQQDGSSQDWLDDALSFTVIDPKGIAGLAHLQAKVAWSKQQIQ